MPSLSLRCWLPISWWGCVCVSECWWFVSRVAGEVMRSLQTCHTYNLRWMYIMYDFHCGNYYSTLFSFWHSEQRASLTQECSGDLDMLQWKSTLICGYYAVVMWVVLNTFAYVMNVLHTVLQMMVPTAVNLLELATVRFPQLKLTPLATKELW